uniref:Chromo domain-containing protein n=1 Tax=Meloidogyne incognita TaxID=6306 RepID=A0A914M762_MELIC
MAAFNFVEMFFHEKENLMISEFDSRINPRHLQQEEMEYKVEKILNKKLKNGREQYLIKWSGFGPKWNSWEPKKNIQHLEEFKNYLVEEKEEELLKREEKLERMDRSSRKASREALKKIFLMNSPNCMRRKIVDEAQVDSMQEEEEDEEEEGFEEGNYRMETDLGEDVEDFEGGNYGMEGMGEAAFGEADRYTSTDLCRMLGLIDVQFEYNGDDFEYNSSEKSFNVCFQQQFQDMNPTAEEPFIRDVLSLKYKEFQNILYARGKQLAGNKVDRIAGSTPNPPNLQPTSSTAGSGQIKKNMLSGKKVVRFAESTSNPPTSKDLQPSSSVNSNQEFESLLKEDKKKKAKEENKKERAESKKNKDSEQREKEENWKNFFEACCDILTETRKKYASSFVKQRIQPHLLRDLGKDDLRTLGISALGDQLAIINYIKKYGGTPPEFLPPPEKTLTPPAPVTAAPATPPPVPSTPPAPATHPPAPVDDDILILEEEDVYNPAKPILSPAPDRHDIYPTGESNSKKAKNIFEVHNNLREQGFIKI